jgi:hypothetical protein
MLARKTDERRLQRLGERLQHAQVVNADLMREVIAAIPAHNRAVKADRIDQLIQAEAWTEAALVLLEVVQPQWRPRGIVYREGAWWCSLGKQWNVPDWLDDTAEATHDALPLAILGALIEARRQSQASVLPATRAGAEWPVASSPHFEMMCCDNFA